MSNNPDVIKEEIDAIQQRMKLRANAIGERLSPSRLVNDTFTSVSSDPKGSLNQLIDTVKNHPVASAMVTAGLMSVAGAASRDKITETYQTSGASEKVDKGIAQTKRRARTMAKSTSDAANSISESVEEVTENLEASARDKIEQASRKANTIAKNTSAKTKDLAGEAKQFASDNPVALGLFAVGIGALAASMFTAKRSTGSSSEVLAKPAVRQAKKATRAKSQPNKTVKKMSPAGKTEAAKKTATKKKPTRTRKTASTTSRNKATTTKA